jgi:hypothetical protein
MPGKRFTAEKFISNAERSESTCGAMDAGIQSYATA